MNEEELRDKVAGIMYDTDYKHTLEQPYYYDAKSVEGVVDLIFKEREAAVKEANEKYDNMYWWFYGNSKEDLKEYERQLQSHTNKHQKGSE